MPAKPSRRVQPPQATSPIRFESVLQAAGSRTILRLPQSASTELPSRGQVAVLATIQGRAFGAIIEPDGECGHWMSLDAARSKAIGAAPGDTIGVEIEPAAAWPEPTVPRDLAKALADAPPSIRDTWRSLTPMARWEWVRWVNATRNPDTRKKRVEVSISKLESGKRRPCCFNLASCTDPELSKNGKLALR